MEENLGEKEVQVNQIQMKDFIKKIILNPVEIIKEYATGKNTKVSYAFVAIFLILMCSVINACIGPSLSTPMEHIISSLSEYVDSILLYTVIIYVFFNKNKHEFKTIFSVFAVSHIPFAYIYLTSLVFRVTGMKMYTLLMGLSSAFEIMLTVLTYIAIKELVGNENKGAIVLYWMVVIATAVLNIIY